MSNLRFWLLGCNSYGAASKIGSEETLQVGLTQTNLVLVGEAPGTCTKLHQRYIGIPQDIPHHILPWSFGESQLASWMNSMNPFLVSFFFFSDGFSPRVAGLSCAYWFVGHPVQRCFMLYVDENTAKMATKRHQSNLEKEGLVTQRKHCRIIAVLN